MYVGVPIIPCMPEDHLIRDGAAKSASETAKITINFVRSFIDIPAFKLSRQTFYMKNTTIMLLLILAIAFSVRMIPAFWEPMAGIDSYYHLRLSEMVKENGL